MVKINGWMPEKMRKKMVSKQNASNLAKLPRDLHDLNSKSPYLIEDMIKKKIVASDLHLSKASNDRQENS